MLSRAQGVALRLGKRLRVGCQVVVTAGLIVVMAANAAYQLRRSASAFLTPSAST